MPPTANEQLIEAYFHIVEQDDYAGVGAILTDERDMDHHADRPHVDRSPRGRIHGHGGRPQPAARRADRGRWHVRPRRA